MDQPIKAWGGFVDGKLHIVRAHDEAGPEWRSPQIFTNKRAARRQYEDVRRVEIRVID